MYPAYVSKYNTERKKQITLLMVEKVLLSCRNKDIYIIQRNNIKYNDDCYYSNYLHSFRTKTKLNYPLKQGNFPAKGNVGDIR